MKRDRLRLLRLHGKQRHCHGHFDVLRVSLDKCLELLARFRRRERLGERLRLGRRRRRRTRARVSGFAVLVPSSSPARGARQSRDRLDHEKRAHVAEDVGDQIEEHHRHARRRSRRDAGTGVSQPSSCRQGAGRPGPGQSRRHDARRPGGGARRIPGCVPELP